MLDLITLKPVSGGMFQEQITSKSEQVVLTKDGLDIIFSRKDESFGKDFDWHNLDLSGLRLGKASGNKKEYFINIQPGCWLSKKLNNEKCSIEIQAKGGKGLFLQSHALLNEHGALKADLPQCYLGIINQVEKKDGKLCFLLRKTCALTIEIQGEN